MLIPTTAYEIDYDYDGFSEPTKARFPRTDAPERIAAVVGTEVGAGLDAGQLAAAIVTILNQQKDRHECNFAAWISTARDGDDPTLFAHTAAGSVPGSFTHLVASLMDLEDEYDGEALVHIYFETA